MQFTQDDLITKLICERTGLHIREEDSANFNQIIQKRLHTLRFHDQTSYHNFLTQTTKESHDEWKELYALLTTGESYFFRDKGQFSLIKNYILDELIKAHRDTRGLRIWSAGCSTGEEPYSIAILLTQLLPDIDDWDVFILGTDINGKALERAKQAIYTDWSFRLVDSEIKTRYFRKHKNSWEVDKEIRKLVHFRESNLIQDEFTNIKPGTNFNQNTDINAGTGINLGIYDMDLILCRNVFIYFSPETIAHVVRKLSSVLADGGFLLTGHAEIQNMQIDSLKSIVMPESIVYKRESVLQASQSINQKMVTPCTVLTPTRTRVKETAQCLATRKAGQTRPAQPQQTPQQTSQQARRQIPRSASPQAQGNHPEASRHANSKLAPEKESFVCSQAMPLFAEQRYDQVVDLALHHLQLVPDDYEATYMLALSYANLGQYVNARVASIRALELNPLNAQAYFLLAHIHEQEGNIDETKELLKKVIYLDQTYVCAYIELAYIYERQKNTKQAKKMFESAMQILSAYPAHTCLESYCNVPVGELVACIAKIIRGL